jgi:1-acyl-sn-glycerol-3-phosphate acyltransferase
MLFRVLRWITGIALRWFYREIEVAGLCRVPRDAPLLIAGNHPNALVDALVIGRAMPRTVTLTAKATIFDVPVLSAFLRRLPIVPLRRASDEARRDPAQRDGTARNVEAFRAILDALAERQAVLIFPEGRSHSEPQLAPLKTGVARLALQARDERGIRDLHIVPVGLTFEDKAEPRSRVLLQVGEPIDMDRWPGGADSVEALMVEVDARLRAVTLNFPSRDDAHRVVKVARLLAGVFDAPRPLGAPDAPLSTEAEIVRRVDRAERALRDAGPDARARVERLTARLETFETELDRRGIAVNDLELPLDAARGTRFALREALIAGLGGPVAWWGRLNHWLPLRVARWFAVRHTTTEDEPAMYTIVGGLALVILAYAVQTALVWSLGGAGWAVAYLLTLPIAESWDIVFRDRLRRAGQRMHTYLLLRRDAALCERLRAELAWLREETAAVEERAKEQRGMRKEESTART